jgi:hypothetical protein
MPFFQTRIIHTTDPFNFSPFSSEEMMDIADVGLKSAVTRIARAEDIHDQPAPPLTQRYADRKVGPKAPKPGLKPIRDWNWRGLTRASLKVLTASENQAILGPTNGQADLIISAQNRRSPQWPFSENDRLATFGAIQKTLYRKSPLMVPVDDTGNAASVEEVA